MNGPNQPGSGEPSGETQDGLFEVKAYKREVDLEAERDRIASGSLASAEGREPEEERPREGRKREVQEEQTGGPRERDPWVDALIAELQAQAAAEVQRVRLNILSQEQAEQNARAIDEIVHDLQQLGEDFSVDRFELRRRLEAMRQAQESKLDRGETQGLLTPLEQVQAVLKGLHTESGSEGAGSE
jgi:hypothetical protein